TWKDDNEKYPNRTFDVIPKTNESASHYGDDITYLSSNNSFKQNTFTSTLKIAIINNYFYTCNNKKVA
ncbi:MAG: hypothetical protein Q7U00_08915, partial [Sulfurimonas sp.]|nr:hypothetical protein [Sulfurimonas sp.]